MTAIELGSTLLLRRECLARRLFGSEKVRARLISVHEASCERVPERADVALVMGTSFKLYPDKFQKRVYTGTQLLLNGRVAKVIFSGSSDRESRDENQALQAKIMATEKFGLAASDALTVGGENTKENIEEAKRLLANHTNVKSLFLVTDNRHLIRALPLARHIFGEVGTEVYPLPIPGEEPIDPNDPGVIREMIKAVLYNGVMNKNQEPTDVFVKGYIDEIVKFYLDLIDSMPFVAETTFDVWRKTNFS